MNELVECAYTDIPGCTTRLNTPLQTRAITWAYAPSWVRKGLRGTVGQGAKVVSLSADCSTGDH